MIEQALRRLYTYCRERDWKGWDPYDGLNSRLFQALPFKRWRLWRLAWTQLFKRSPLNLRRLAGVPGEENPKGLALFARSMVHLQQAKCDWIEPDDVSHLFARLERLRSPGYEPWCWGYNFDWQGRAFFARRFAPNAVATVFAAHAFLDRYEAGGDAGDLEKARSACAFILGSLYRPGHLRNGAAPASSPAIGARSSQIVQAKMPALWPREEADQQNGVVPPQSEEVCFSYTPHDDTQVHNVNFLIAALLARVSAAADEPSLADWAHRALAFSVARQADDGSWSYGTAPYQKWVDHFHTCYNLLALEECWHWLRTDVYDEAIERGLTFYLDHLFRNDGLPRPDTQALFPIDIHAVALALITLERFADRRRDCRALREKIVEWALGEMQDREGFFYYQKRAHSMVRIPYMRWSQAWMFYALSQSIVPARL